MEIHQYQLALSLSQGAVDNVEGAVQAAFKEHIAHQVDDGDYAPARVDVNYAVTRRGAVGEVCRARDERAAVEQLKSLLAAKGVVAERYCVNAAFEQVISRSRCYAVAVGGIFAVADDKINSLYLF